MFCAWGLECGSIQEVKRIMERYVNLEWRQGLDALLGQSWVEDSLRPWGDRVAMSGYLPYVHPFILWRVMEDWELVLASGVPRELMDLNKLKFKLVDYWQDEHPQGRRRGRATRGRGVLGGCNSKRNQRREKGEQVDGGRGGELQE
ncbi:hypothetical protein SUGI_1110000 [Cryptomeria japonica]|nr:hypothetical protein SUGI_1110000 [Cryptomeria japonica]